MNETEKNMDNYIKELLTINEDINKQLQVYKDKEDKIIELITAPIDGMLLDWQSKYILQILNEGDK